MEGSRIDHRKIYAKGWYDGIAAAHAGGKVTSLHEGSHMRQALMEAKLRNVSSTEKKIYDVVPISQAWTLQQINSELRRLNLTVNLRSVEWSVRTLKDQGLIVEPSPGTFQRVKFREKPVKSEPDMPDTPKETETPPPLQQKIVEFASRLHGFADEVELLAVELDDMLENRDQENKKLRELKQLLNSLGA